MKNLKTVNVGRVAFWEFTKGIKSPMFIFMTLVLPVIIVLVGGIDFFAERLITEEKMSIAVIDETDSFFPYLEKQAEDSAVEVVLYSETQEEVMQKVEENTYDGLVLISLEGLDAGRLSFYARDLRNVNPNLIQQLVTTAAGEFRLLQKELPVEEVKAALAPVQLETKALEEGRDFSIAEVVVPIAFMVILLMSIVFSGQILMYGVIKEKRNRIVEILLSSVSSVDLMVGKILGYGTLSLIQLAIWVAAGLLVASRVLGFDELNLNVGDFILPFGFFILGYIMIASLFAALGSTMKEAEEGSQAQGLVILVPMIPMFISAIIVAMPNALWVRILSHIPPFIPAMVFMRMSFTTIPAWELITIFMALILSILLFIYLGARIFEKGILQYETISFRQIKNMLLGRV